MLLMLMPFASTFVLIWPCPGHQMGAQWHVTRGILTITCRIRDPATGRIPHLTVIMQCLLTAGHLTPWPQTMRRSQGQTSDTISSVSLSLSAPSDLPSILIVKTRKEWFFLTKNFTALVDENCENVIFLKWCKQVIMEKLVLQIELSFPDWNEISIAQIWS